MQSLSTQIITLFLLALPIACVSWTVTHEEIFREPREWCLNKSTISRRMLYRKFFYVFTCEYCFSHYITIIFLLVTRFVLLFSDWRGYLLAGFALVWIANFYMSLFGWMRLGMRHERQEIAKSEQEETVAETGAAPFIARRP